MPDGRSKRASPALSVVVCSFNGEQGVERTFLAVDAQTIRDRLEVILVDDGSTDGTAAVGDGHGAHVVRHGQNRGLSCARNTGLQQVSADLVAYLDDDCEPASDWAETLVATFEHAEPAVVAIVGSVTPTGPPGLLIEFLTRNNPLQPVEIELARSTALPYRLSRYLARSWAPAHPPSQRPVYSLVGAAMAFRTTALRDVGGFDEAFVFGSDDLDVSIRLREQFGDRCLVFEPGVVVLHHFEPSLRDTLRRARSYGRGHVRLLAAHPELPPTVFPLPIACVALLAGGLRQPGALALAIVLPHLVHPRGIRSAGSSRFALADAYLTCLQEAAFDVGVVEAWAGRTWSRPDSVPHRAGRGRAAR